VLLLLLLLLLLVCCMNCNWLHLAEEGIPAGSNGSDTGRGGDSCLCKWLHN
jgi:hypothetical protein